MTMANLRSVCVAVALCLLACMPRIAPAQDLENLRSAEVAQRALPRAPQLPRSAFLENRTLAAAQLSPAGDFVAYLREQKDSRALWLLPANGGSPRMLVGNTQAEQVTWSRDGRWLFLRAPRSLTMVGVDGRTGVRVPLGGNERRQVIKLDPSQTAALLLRERRVVGQSDVRWQIVRMDAHGKRTLLREDTRWGHDVAVDVRGRIVAVCGGAASDPLAAPILVGLGVTELSAAPAAIPEIKATIAALTLGECKALADRALAADGPDAVRALTLGATA